MPIDLEAMPLRMVGQRIVGQMNSPAAIVRKADNIHALFAAYLSKIDEAVAADEAATAARKGRGEVARKLAAEVVKLQCEIDVARKDLLDLKKIRISRLSPEDARSYHEKIVSLNATLKDGAQLLRAAKIEAAAAKKNVTFGLDDYRELLPKAIDPRKRRNRLTEELPESRDKRYRKAREAAAAHAANFEKQSDEPPGRPIHQDPTAESEVEIVSEAP